MHGALERGICTTTLDWDKFSCVKFGFVVSSRVSVEALLLDLEAIKAHIRDFDSKAKLSVGWH